VSRSHLNAAGTIGNVLEWYDFSIYGFFALQIGAVFFPSGDRVAEALAALASLPSATSRGRWARSQSATSATAPAGRLPSPCQSSAW
jgi:hypothetical protein